VKLTRRIPIARIKQGVRLVLEMDTKDTGFVERETILQLERVKALLMEERIDSHKAILTLVAYGYRLSRAGELARRGRITERQAVRLLRQA
jgi:hypothetical protein